MPLFDLVGYLSSDVKEAKNRVRSSVKNSGFSFPISRITVNLSPASLRKSGSGFDLPIAISLLAASGQIPSDHLSDVMMFGELGLNGRLRPVRGILPMALAAKKAGFSHVLVPTENQKEASLVPNLTVLAVSSLSEAAFFFRGGTIESHAEEQTVSSFDGSSQEEHVDFSSIRGQSLLKRACEISAAGMHNLLFVGPPGAGKTLAARALPTILPPMKEEEQLEVSRIYSACGLFGERESLMLRRPFRSPHHTATPAALSGGGFRATPGEVSLAHGGVLFLDELPEFRRETLEILRQPLEERRIVITRRSGVYTYPADFILLAAMNPCRCGYYPDLSRCTCTRTDVLRYHSKLSGPLLDRFDLFVHVPEADFMDLTSDEPEESSETIRCRVMKAHQIQAERFSGKNYHFNGRIPAADLGEFCTLGESEKAFAKSCFESLHMTARGYHRLLRIGRTIADLDGSGSILKRHLEEALFYKSFRLLMKGEGL